MALIKPKVVALTKLRLRALCRAIHRTRGESLYDGLLLQGIMTEWIANVKAEGGFYCPKCLNIMSTPERREACPHDDGKGGTCELLPADEEASFRHWIGMGERGD